jgi:hypothetical protein
VATGPRFAAALLARERADRGPSGQDGFDLVVTRDRELVIRAAEPLPRGLVPRP